MGRALLHMHATPQGIRRAFPSLRRSCLVSRTVLVALYFPSAQSPPRPARLFVSIGYRRPTVCSEVESLMRHFDRNSDGVIDYVEFYNTLTRHQVAL
jgi:hypothetical protein